MGSDEEVKPQFGDYQLEIYLAGLRGIKPDLPVDAAALEARAEAAMPPALLSYVQGGCGDEFTQRRNVEAFKDWGLVPRMLVDTSRRDLSIELFGMKLPHPLFMCPIGVAGICAQDGHGDLAIAEAARASGFPVTISTLGNDPIEKVGAVLGDGIGFFQLYTPKDRGLAESFVKRAENAGFKALIVTLDTWIPGWRPRDLSGCCSKSFRLSPRGKQPVHPILMSPVKYTAHGFPSPRGLIVKFLH